MSAKIKLKANVQFALTRKHTKVPMNGIIFFKIHGLAVNLFCKVNKSINQGGWQGQQDRLISVRCACVTWRMEINGRSSEWGAEGGDWREMVLGVGRPLDGRRLPSMKSCHHAFRWWPCWFYTWLAVSASLRCSNTAPARWDVACAMIGGRQWACSPSHRCNSRINH